MGAWSFEMLEGVVDAVVRAPSTTDALAGLTDAMRSEFDLWGAVAVVYDTDGTRTLAAVHASAPTFFEPGMKIATTLTSATRAHWEELMRGRPVTFDVTEEDLGLLKDLLLADGVRSVAAFPLQEHGRSLGAIRLWSASAGAFSSELDPLLTGLGHGLEEHLIALLRAEGWLPAA